MADQDRRHDAAPEGGVFGKLPATRPGVRSPRRQTGSPKAHPADPPKGSESAPGQVGGAPRPSARDPDRGAAPPGGRPRETPGRGPGPPPPSRPETAREPEAPEPGDAPGVEDLAWAGVTVAAEAATLGVRLVSRALEAVRRPTDRG
jgi:hypothetical protein